VRRLVSVVAVLVLAFCALCGSAGAARFYTPSYGSGPPEVIGGFDLGADGSLAPIPGSPFPGEESGTGGLWGIAFTPDGSAAVSPFLFSGGVQGYSVPPSGAFGLANTIPTASATGIAVTPDGRFAYAGTRAVGASPSEGIRRFAVGSGGSLTALTPSGGGTEEYGDVAITPDGRYLFAAQSGKVQRFAIGADGSLTPLGATPSPNAEFMAVSPDGRFLFLEVFGGSSGGVATFAISPDGQVKQAGATALVSDSFPKIFSVAPDGRHVYLPDSNNNQIYTFAIAEDGTPSLAGEVKVENPEMVGASPDGRHLVFYERGSVSGLGVASIGPDGGLTILPTFLPWSTGEAERLTFQPQPTPVARLSATTAPAGGATRFDAGASERAARYDWNFGDGADLANGGPTPTHTYANPGSYQVTLVVTDSQGCSLRQVYTGQSTVCPGGAAARAVTTVAVPPATKPNPAPVLGKVRAVPKKFAPKVRGAKPGKVKLGTTFRYTVSEAATVRFKFERKQGKRFKKLGSRPQPAKKGANKLKWNGKLKGKPLPPGHYRATVVAADKEGGRSKPKRVGFRILPVPPSR
jgi:6-phosphogluconolactonase (cycloisomerase 2 family)